VKRWTVILAAALIFTSGIITGALAFRAAQVCQGPPERRTHSLSPIEARFATLRRMQAELNLTPEQTNRIDAILQDGCKRLRQIWESTCQPEVREEMKRVHARIQAELNEEQRIRYEQLVKRTKDKRGPKHLKDPPGLPEPHP
jgi:hypothetical protein